MPNLNFGASFLGIITFLLSGIAVSGLVLFWRRVTDKGLTALSLAAWAVALAFTPLVRAVPEQIGFLLIGLGLWPALATLAVAVVASMARFIQTRRWGALPNLLLSVGAAGLFYINFTTPLFWPYQVY